MGNSVKYSRDLRKAFKNVTNPNTPLKEGKDDGIPYVNILTTEKDPSGAGRKVKTIPSKMKIGVARFDNKHNTDVLYTSKEDYDYIMQMENMSNQEYDEYVSKQNQKYREQDRMENLKDAREEYHDQQQFRSKQLKQKEYSLDYDKLPFMKDETDTNKIQKAKEGEDDFDEDFDKNLEMLSANIFSKYTDSNVGQVPEFLKGKLARAKPQRIANKDDFEEVSGSYKYPKAKSERKRLIPNRNEAGNTVLSNPVYDMYNPKSIKGTFTIKQYKELCDRLKFAQNEEQSSRIVENFSKDAGLDKELIFSLLKSFNSAHIESTPVSSYAFWHIPDYSKQWIQKQDVKE